MQVVKIYQEISTSVEESIKDDSDLQGATPNLDPHLGA